MAASASSAHSRSTSRAWSITACARSRASASATSASSSIGPDSRCRSRAEAGSVVRDSSRAGSVATPSRRSVPGVLPDCPVSLTMSSRSSESWKATPIRSPNRVRISATASSAPDEHGAEPGRGARSASRSCRRAPAGGARSGRRPVAARPSRGSARAPAARRCAPGCGRTPGPRSARMSEARAKRKSPVRIAMLLPQRALALDARRGGRRLVHDVVVVERGEVGQLDHDGGRDDPGAAGVAELGGEQHQQRAEPLAAGLDQVQRRLGDERVAALDRLRAAAPRPRPARRAARRSSAGSANTSPTESGRCAAVGHCEHSSLSGCRSGRWHPRTRRTGAITRWPG